MELGLTIHSNCPSGDGEEEHSRKWEQEFPSSPMLSKKSSDLFRKRARMYAVVWLAWLSG